MLLDRLHFNYVAFSIPATDGQLKIHGGNKHLCQSLFFHCESVHSQYSFTMNSQNGLELWFYTDLPILSGFVWCAADGISDTCPCTEPHIPLLTPSSVSVWRQ